MNNENAEEIVRIRLELTEVKTNLRHAEITIRDKTQEFDKVNTILKENEEKLKRTIEELNSLNTTYEVLKERHRQIVIKLAQKEKNIKKQKTTVVLRSLITSALFLLSTVLAGFGINTLTSINSNPVGWVMICLAAITYVFATYESISFTTGESK